MRCDKCYHTAIIHQKYSGMHLCKRHFEKDVERKVKHSIRRYKLIERGDIIVFALSGGKDSTVVLHIIHSLFKDHPGIQLIAISVDEGIHGYREKTLKTAKQVCKKLNIRHEIVSFEDQFGLTLDQMAILGERAPCTYCGVFRRVILNRTAKALGATKLATGHCLDDEAQTVLMNLLRGDIERLVRLMPTKKPGLVPRIKPLRNVPEKEVALYALLKELPVLFDACPYAHLSLRAEIRDMLNVFEVKHPSTKYSLMKSFDILIKSLKKEMEEVDLQRCEICGEPTMGSMCQACKLLKIIESRR
ncbi:MAG: TIGR00269 family protein [Methanocellales archaeon]|nr:TIGR00269 family protein [Methanocellales archaeon]